MKSTVHRDIAFVVAVILLAAALMGCTYVQKDGESFTYVNVGFSKSVKAELSPTTRKVEIGNNSELLKAIVDKLP